MRRRQFFGRDALARPGSTPPHSGQVFRCPSTFRLKAERYFEIGLRAKVDGRIVSTLRGDRGPASCPEGAIFMPVGTDAPTGAPLGFIGSDPLLQGLAGRKRICAPVGASARIGVILSAPRSGEPMDEPIFRGRIIRSGDHPLELQ